MPSERYNVKKLLAHPFITGDAEILQNPTLDFTKEKENIIFENYHSEHNINEKNANNSQNIDAKIDIE